jgi:hypothetical protein
MNRVIGRALYGNRGSYLKRESCERGTPSGVKQVCVI